MKVETESCCKGEVEIMESCKGEVKCKVSGKRLWRAAFEDAHNFLPEALPNTLASMDYDGGVFQPGSFRTVHYRKGYAKRVSKEHCIEHLVESTREKILEVDHDSLKLKVQVVDGGYLGITATWYTYAIHIMEGALPNTCVAHWCFEYKPISPKHHAIMCEVLKEVLPLSFKGVEAYLLAHDAYQD